MTELKPVALLNIFDEGYTTVTQYTVTDEGLVSSVPLYTKEQLYPIAEMTQEEFDEFEIARNEYENPCVFLYYLASLDSERKKFKKLFSWIYKNEHGKDLECELLFHKLWVDYELEKRGGAVKIVPTMKWFVRSKEQYQPDMDQGISESGYLYLTQGNIYSIEYYETTTFKDDAQQFDTKEEAEKWENPLTEAVLLPVEDE